LRLRRLSPPLHCLDTINRALASTGSAADGFTAACRHRPLPSVQTSLLAILDVDAATGHRSSSRHADHAKQYGATSAYTSVSSPPFSLTKDAFIPLLITDILRGIVVDIFISYYRTSGTEAGIDKYADLLLLGGSLFVLYRIFPTHYCALPYH
jgi:hypothetical protein